MGLLFAYHFRRTTLFLASCIALLGSIGLSRLVTINIALWPLILVAICLISIGRRRWLSLTGAILLFAAFGYARGNLYMHRLALYDDVLNQTVTLKVDATEDAVYGTHTQLSFVATNIIDTANSRKLPGKILVSGFGSSAIYQGDTVLASGKPYRGIGAYQGFLSFADLQVVRHHSSPIDSLRRRFTAGMQSALPEPLASFAMGLLIGQRATLPDNIKQNLLMVGLTHIIAVSGYNLTIMLDASRKILGNQSKRLSTLLTFSLMLLFILLAGASASIVRAALVSTLSIMASYYGRKPRPLLLILLAAALTAWQNPLYVWGDTSWYLSFLAFFGIMMVSPVLQNRLPRAFEKSVILAVGLESICAEIMTLPFVLYTFGQMSLISLPANMLVVALIPLGMLLSAVAGLAGMLILPVAGWFAWPAKILLTYMLDIAQVLAHLPHVFVQNVWLRLPGLLTLYGLTMFMVVILGYKDRLKSDTITDKTAIDSS